MELNDPARGRRQHEGGLSIVELLISAALIGVVAVGILPLFSMTMQSNLKGQHSTRVANYARGHLESLIQLPFEHAQLTVPNGANERISYEDWARATDTWSAPTLVANLGAIPAADDWQRITRVQDFVLDDTDPTNLIPRAGGPCTPNDCPQVKLITIQVHGGQGLISSNEQITVRAYKTQ